MSAEPISSGPAARVSRILRALLGLTLVVLTTVPLYRGAARREAGEAGANLVELVTLNADFLWSGALVLLLVGLLAGVMAAPEALDRVVERLAGWVRAPSTVAWGASVGAVAFGITLWFSLWVLQGKPNLIDAMAQLVQARYMAAGRLAGPVLENEAFWAFQNMVMTDSGWVSHFPPGHAAWLALFLRLGVLELSGPVVMSVTAVFTYLTLRRLIPGREVAARLGGLGTALSPFLVSHAGSFMNHGPAAALGVLAVYTALRARDGAPWWTLGTGAALGLLIATRPLFSVTMGLAVVVPIGLGGLRRDMAARGFVLRLALAVIAALPFLAAFLAYNAHFFGDPLTFGYHVTAGKGVGLGFRVDPWGNVYSPGIALALTSADLTALSLVLFEIPLPVVAAVGVWLVVARRLPQGAGILATWALAPVVAGFFYWHHGFFMGPRLLSHAAPAWAALVVLALVELVRRAPSDLGSGAVRFSPRAALTATLLAGVLAAGYLAPLRLARRGGEFLPSMRIEPPVPEGPSLVFVHGAWSGRVFARLVARGWQLMRVETALRQNDLCRVYVGLEGTDAQLLEWLDMEPRGYLPEMVGVEPLPGNRFGLKRGSLAPGGMLGMAPSCTAELAADRQGILEVAVLYWQGDLPGLGGDGPMYVRDMGPEANGRLLRAFPDRTPYVLARRAVEEEPLLLPYEAGMERVWTGAEGIRFPMQAND